MSLIYSIKTRLVELSHKSTFWDKVYYFSKYTTAKVVCGLLGEEGYAKWFYQLYTGRRLDLNDPKRFDEKIWWLKLNNRDPLMTKCSDKAAVRKYVEDAGFADQLIPQYGVYKNPDEIDFEKASDEIVVKCNHNSGGMIFYDPKKPLSTSELNAKKRLLSYILKQDASILSREWNYKNIPHKIVVEKVIRDREGKLPLDYKFMCFDGEPRLLFLDLGVINSDMTYNHDYPRNIYDMDFRLLPVHETRPNAPYEIEKPANFEFMVEMARQLSKPFVHCRVDLYNVDGKVYFGEITFYHGGGCNNIQPEEWDYKIGSWIDLSNPKIIRK